MTERLAADPAGIAVAAALIRAGQLVAFPTETVYGLGADATAPAAVGAIFDAKGRPHFNPLIVHVIDAGAAWSEVVPSEVARALADAFWPGPLTLVLPRRITSRVALLAGAGLDTLAVRVPAHPVARALLAEVGVPLAAPSANRSGQVSPTRAAHVLDGLSGRIAAVLDGGACAVGVESSVLDLTQARPVLLRPGGVTAETIEDVIGPIARGIPHSAAEASRTSRSPGLMVSHYAPTLPVRLDVTEVARDEALLAFGPPLEGAGAVFQLSAARDTTEAAAQLFEGLRTLDASGMRAIAVMTVSGPGLGEVVRDRLARAAAPRSQPPGEWRAPV